MALHVRQFTYRDRPGHHEVAGGWVGDPYLLTDGAVEFIDLIFIEAEALTVGGLAVVAVGSCCLRLLKTFPVQLLEIILVHQLVTEGQRVKVRGHFTLTCLISLSGIGTLHSYLLSLNGHLTSASGLAMMDSFRQSLHTHTHTHTHTVSLWLRGWWEGG